VKYTVTTPLAGAGSSLDTIDPSAFVAAAIPSRKKIPGAAAAIATVTGALAAPFDCTTIDANPGATSNGTWALI
jgi:hypothetical protein